MTHIKEPVQSQVGHHSSDNLSIKSLPMHKDILSLADHIICDSRQNEDYSSSRYCMNFIICRNCFWCATLLGTKQRKSENCPICFLDVLEAIPLASNEKAKVSFDQRVGLALEFSIRSK